MMTLLLTAFVVETAILIEIGVCKLIDWQGKRESNREDQERKLELIIDRIGDVQRSVSILAKYLETVDRREKEE